MRISNAHDFTHDPQRGTFTDTETWPVTPPAEANKAECITLTWHSYSGHHPACFPPGRFGCSTPGLAPGRGEDAHCSAQPGPAEPMPGRPAPAKPSSAQPSQARPGSPQPTPGQPISARLMSAQPSPAPQRGPARPCPGFASASVPSSVCSSSLPKCPARSSPRLS